MSKLLWRKALRDLWLNLDRTMLAVLAVTIGIFGVGSILSSYAILTREIDANFQSTHPASAVLTVRGADHALAAQLAARPDVAEAVPYRMVQARLLIGTDEWLPLLLYVVDSFEDREIATFTLEQGSLSAVTGDILIERSSLVSGQPGDMLTIRTPNGQNTDLRVSAVVHDAAQAPGWQDRIAYGYVMLDTLEMLGEEPIFNELRLTVAEMPLDIAHITDVAYDVKAFIEGLGYPVSMVYVPHPGEHPHRDQMDSLLFLLQAFGVVTLILSAILVSNIISALLAQQVRQIGVMKAIGGSVRQIALLYFGMVVVIGVLALLIGVPFGQSAGRGYAALTATMLNFNITDDSIPAWVYWVQIGVGLSLPVLAAAIPVMRGSRMTVRDAMSDYGTGVGGFGTGMMDGLTLRVRGLSRPLLLSLRNTFRRRVRLALTLGILTVGGAAFISAITVGASWSNTLDVSFQARRYDMEVRFVQPQPIAEVQAILSSVPGVVKVETWQQRLAVSQREDGTDEGRFNVTGLPPESTMLTMPVMQGRWLRPDDTNAVVINHELLLDPEAPVALDETLTLRFGDMVSEWEVVGVVQEIGAPRRGLATAAAAYANLDALNALTGADGTTSNLRIESSQHDNAFTSAVMASVEHAFDVAGFARTTIQLTTERELVLQEHLVVIIIFLVLMAALIAGVGGLALASSMSINVMERAREIGVMRAIGASSGVILRLVMTEGVLIGLLSWVLAVALSLPLSVLIGDIAGQIFIRAPLNYVFPPTPILGWLMLVVIVSMMSSALPAWGAARLTVREVLAYE